jgi:predicted DNA-binding transcriptional regulator AlpA
MAQLNKMLTVKDIQSIFGMGKNQAYALMNSSGFPSFRINDRIYVSEDALNEWVKTYIGKTYLL